MITQQPQSDSIALLLAAIIRRARRDVEDAEREIAEDAREWLEAFVSPLTMPDGWVVVRQIASTRQAKRVTNADSTIRT